MVTNNFLEFKGSPAPTLGVEIELQLIDAMTGALWSPSERFLAACRKAGIAHVKSETHQSMVEVDTEICTDVSQCRQSLRTRMIQLRQVGDALGVRMASSGSHPFHKWADLQVTKDPRYDYLRDKFRWIFERMSVHGMHVHVGLASGDRAIRVCNEASFYLPHLLALSASSPFWQGADTGLQSCRTGIMESFPYSGLPYRFDHWKEFEHFYSQLVGIGAIQSMKDLYWFIRPSPTYGTVEFRICDALSTLEETLAVVALTQCLVVWIDRKEEAVGNSSQKRRRYWAAPSNQWAAARDGLDASIALEEGGRASLREDILRLVDTLRPLAGELRCVKEMARRGTSSERQRAVLERTGSWQSVVESVFWE